MPISFCTTPANGDERQQVLPLLDTLKVKTVGGVDPRNDLRCLRRIKATTPSGSGKLYEDEGLEGRLPSADGETKNAEVALFRCLCHDFSKNDALLGSGASIEDRLCAGSD
jgi:hypothetical protein